MKRDLWKQIENHNATFACESKIYLSYDHMNWLTIDLTNFNKNHIAFFLCSVDIEHEPKYDYGDNNSPEDDKKQKKSFQTFSDFLHTVDADVTVLSKFLRMGSVGWAYESLATMVARKSELAFPSCANITTFKAAVYLNFGMANLLFLFRASLNLWGLILLCLLIDHIMFGLLPD